MKTILKLITVSALGAILASGAFAQAAGPKTNGVKGEAGKSGKLGHKNRDHAIWAKLTPALSTDQKTRLDQINDKTKASMKALRGKAQSGNREVLKAEMQKIHAERKAAIEALLTPAQKRSYETLKKEAFQKARAGKNGKAGKPGKSGKVG